MTFWSTHFHKSDAEDVLERSIDGIKDDVVQMQVRLGNEGTENSLVHDVETLKDESRAVRAETRRLETRANDMEAESEQLKRNVAAVRKMEGPRGFGWLGAQRQPLPSDGRQGDFFVDTAALTVHKKVKSGWIQFGSLEGRQGVQGEQGRRGEQGERGEQGKRGIQGER